MLCLLYFYELYLAWSGMYAESSRSNPLGDTVQTCVRVVEGFINTSDNSVATVLQMKSSKFYMRAIRRKEYKWKYMQIGQQVINSRFGQRILNNIQQYAKSIQAYWVRVFCLLLGALLPALLLVPAFIFPSSSQKVISREEVIECACESIFCLYFYVYFVGAVLIRALQMSISPLQYMHLYQPPPSDRCISSRFHVVSVGHINILFAVSIVELSR